MASHSSNNVSSFPSSSSSYAQRPAARNIFTEGQTSTRRSESEPSDSRLKWEKEYWDSIDSEERKSFLEISISDLKEHFSKSTQYKTMSKVLSHVQEQRALIMFICCECHKAFSDSDSFLRHIKQDHRKMRPRNLIAELPEKVDKAFAEMIISSDWKPIAIEADEKENRDQERESLSPVQKRADHLRTIQRKFQWLSEHGCLSYSHLNEVMRFAKNELQGFSSRSPTLNEAFSLLSTSICSLDYGQLDRISTFLEELMNSCRGAEDVEWPPDETEAEKMVFPIEKTLRCDSIKLWLNKSFFLVERQFCKFHGNSSESGIDDTIFLSLFSSQNLHDEIMNMKFSNGRKLLQLIDGNSNQLQSYCLEKCRQSKYKGILVDVEQSIREELKKRESLPEYSSVSYKSIVSERLGKYRRVAPLPENSSSEMEVLSDILKEARNHNSDYFDCDPMSVGVKDPMTAWDSLDISEDIISHMIQKIKDRIAVKICKNDARILQTLASRGLYEIKLGRILTFDVRLSLVSFMKIFMRSQLEVLGAAKKADAAAVALLMEEASEKKDNVKESSKKPGTMQGKSKNKKKKKKRQQKSEGIKACDVSEDSSEKEEKISFDTTAETETGTHRAEIPNEELYNQPSIEEMGPLIQEPKDLEKSQIKFHGNSMDGENSVNEGESAQIFGSEAQSRRDDQPSGHSQKNGKQQIPSFSLGDFKFGTICWSDVIAKGEKPT